MNNMKSRIISTLIILAVALTAGCNRARKYPLQGEVVAKNAARGEITVRHGDIPGFMSAMVMPYRVKDQAILRDILPGDRIAAQVVVGENPGDYWLEEVRLTEKSARVPGPPSAAPHRLMPGD